MSLLELAALETRVALFGQERGKGLEPLLQRFRRNDFVSLADVSLLVAFEFDGVEAGEQGTQRRAADAGGRIALGEYGATGREPIEVRCLDDLGPHESEISIAMVVADDQDDVRRPHRCGVGAAGQGAEQAQGERVE